MSHLVYLCIDTTGTDMTRDRVIAIKAHKVTDSGTEDFKRYILPDGDWTIDPEATKVNGITNEFLSVNGEDPVTVLNDFNRFISEPKDIDLVTFGGLQFDIRFLNIEYQHYGVKFDILYHRMFDLLDVERRNNANDFVSTYRRHMNTDIDGKSVVGLEDLFWKMSKDYTREQMIGDWRPTIVDPDDLIRQDNAGRLKFVRGKYQDRYVYDIILSDPNYIMFLFNKVLVPQTKQIVINEYETLKKNTDLETTNGK